MNAIGSIDQTQFAQVTFDQSAAAQTRQNVLDSASKALGMDESDVQSALQGGTSLAALATQKGVSQDSLLTAIKDGLTQAGGVQAATGTSLDTAAQQIANRVPGQGGGHHHHHHGGGGGGKMKGVLDDVASALDTDPSTVQSSLANGTSLSALATQQGVSQDTLLTAIKAGLTQNGSDTGDGSLDDFAQAIANRVPGQQQSSPYAGADGSSDPWSSSVDVVQF
jgi:lambda repressor-like predicted transcriptional regulator